MNNNEPKYETMPEHYLLCFNDKCVLADECLCRLAAWSGRQKEELVTAVNPARCSGKKCRRFKQNKVVTMAYGMIDSFHKIKADHIASLRNTLISHFGCGSYYLRRNGLRPIMPKSSGISATCSASLDTWQSSIGWKKRRNGCSTDGLYCQYKVHVLPVQWLCTDDTEHAYDINSSNASR